MVLCSRLCAVLVVAATLAYMFILKESENVRGKYQSRIARAVDQVIDCTWILGHPVGYPLKPANWRVEESHSFDKVILRLNIS
jgi:hypothetical protein